jgi:hypothetical protein
LPTAQFSPGRSADLYLLETRQLLNHARSPP